MNNNVSNFFRSPSFKFIIIGLLSLLLLIPVKMIRGLINEREFRNLEAAEEISKSWSLQQTLTGPFLSINDDKQRMADKDGGFIEENTLHVLPEEVNIECKVNPLEKKRGIFKTVVYTSTLNITGYINVDDKDLKWFHKPRPAYFCIGLSDLRGIGNNSVIKIDGQPYEIKPGLYNTNVCSKGINVPIDFESVSDKGSFSFDITLDLKGSEGIFITPVGKATEVTMSSPWPDPSFTGEYLPDSKQISDSGFTANWSVNYLNRNYPQSWHNAEHHISSSAFGVNFIIPVDHYQKSERSVKYAFMFIALSFLVFFLTEVLIKIRIHPIQYILVGFGLVIFYTLLIALSEQLGFNMAYLISTLAITTLTGAYMKSSTASIKVGLISGTLLLALYGFLFTTLQMQELSLLMGSIGLFIILAVIMVVSRKINWYKE